VRPIPLQSIITTSSLRPSERAAVWLLCLGGLLTVAPIACAQETEKLPIVGISHLPRDLSPWSMFVNADAVVQAVILGLACASVVTWTVCLAKCFELFIARRTLGRLLSLVSGQRLLSQAAILVTNRRGMLPALIDAACREVALSADLQERSGIKQRIAMRLSRLEVAGGRDMNKGTALLATIGATAPFVGLFGTVWGIMNSFVGISKAQTTNLAVVAPGIAEALFATAFGLFTAIPAVVIYNHFSRSISAYRALIGDASAEVLRLASRELDQETNPHAVPLAAE
jgi:biopolymer transport protein ExbB